MASGLVSGKVTSSNSNQSGFEAYSMTITPHVLKEKGRGHSIQAESRACAKRGSKWHRISQEFWYIVGDE